MSSARPPDVSSSTSINSSSSSSFSSSSVSPPPSKSPDASQPPTDSPTPPDKSPPSPPSSSKDSSPSLESDDGSSSVPSPSPLPTSLLRSSRSSSSPVTPSSKSLVHADSTHDSGGSTPADSFSKSSEVHHSDMNLPLIIGMAAGLGLFFVLMVIACVCCSAKKKKKEKDKRHNAMQYYSDPSGYKDSDFYSSGPPQKWHNEDHDMKGPPPPGPLPGGGWHAHHPPPMMNSEDATSAYSAPHGPPLPPPSPVIALAFNKSTFCYEELATATNGFSHANLLGQGGFGYVHKGVLPNGKEIAVKQLKSGSGQGEREFQAEVDIISRVHHRHLVSLVGYCISGSQRMLVYEFVPNKTLEYHLHGKGLSAMDWSTRLKIALGSARGLAYLHEDCHPRIIHRDIKSANILLDLKFEAMVADFGLAKLSSDNHTHVSTRVMGTFGYLAPEYASSGKLTEKSDVFSYGVMLLELITGRRPVDTHTFMEDSLVDWARPVLSRALADGDYDELADPRLDGNYDPMEMARMVACAAASVRHSARRRPKMSQIVRALEGDVSLEDLNEGMRPGQSMLFSSGSDYESNSYTSSMNRLRKVMIASPEYSGAYDGPITEFEHCHSASSSGGFSGDLNPIGKQRHF
ncbi:hypothetical protein C4D60_Mb07t27680 [Musa balbisiana]|uniref:non-specific serine/threonine protein kinase n=1 Tax=Musa balbisiana TaxID=52838 RepID=A0A4S8JIH3_MUSBA|nr:hypothetical protein C4D60_Mb07t27680 [Musa balbisiana]